VNEFSLFEEDKQLNATPISGDYIGMFVKLTHFEGPLDLLLSLAREQKVDLHQISILDLASQYLDFIERAEKLQLELAADFLVMASWLAYLKSRLLLPKEDLSEDEEDPSQIAAKLALQLQRMDLLRKCADNLMDSPQSGKNFFFRGMVGDDSTEYETCYQDNLYDLLNAYGALRLREDVKELRILPTNLYASEEVIEKLRMKIKGHKEWVQLTKFLPDVRRTNIQARSAVAATVLASLELTREGVADIQQYDAYAPIYIKDKK
jgi:segregation and condensation protein A